MMGKLNGPREATRPGIPVWVMVVFLAGTVVGGFVVGLVATLLGVEAQNVIIGAIAFMLAYLPTSLFLIDRHYRSR